MGAEQSALSDESLKRNMVNFLINGKEYTANTDMTHLGPDSLLIDYIRDHAGLKGTKYMCREGGCGACVVTVKTKDVNSGQDIIRPVNSCLMPVFACDGWDITTIEHLGSVRTNLHPIQQSMVKFSASQCGYCTPGWIMNMYGLMEGKKGLTAKDIEDSMDGNICRCTGYRPIFDAMKSFATDASEELKRKCGSSRPCLGCPNTRRDPEETPDEVSDEPWDYECCKEPRAIHMELKSGEQWVKATDMDSLFMALQRFQTGRFKYRVVAGNTGTGVFKSDGPYQAYVEINSVPALTKVDINPMGVTLGGAVTLSSAIEALKKAGEMEGFEYCLEISKHLKRVANTPVRNAGTLAGNLMLKHDHHEFPSDIFVLLETVGAKVTVASAPSLQRDYSPQELLGVNMTGKIILSIQYPKLKSYYFRSFKISRRYQNAHAYVNAGFLFLMDPKKRLSVRDKPSIVFGGISQTFVHATNTELSFVGKSLDGKSLQEAVTALDKELQPDVRPPDAHPEYRKTLAASLLYKFLLGFLGDTAGAKVKSGALDLERRLMYGKQAYDTDKSQWPIYEPVTKLEAPLQVTGEAEYTNDINPEHGELFAAFVVTTVANAELENVDFKDALKIPGVVTFVGAKDIPGTNNFMVTADVDKPDVIFVQDKISHAGQPVGVIVAESQDIAMKAVKVVKLTYKNVQKPILDIPSSLANAQAENRMDDFLIKVKRDSQTKIGSIYRQLKGIKLDLNGIVDSDGTGSLLDDSIRVIKSPPLDTTAAPHTLKGEFRTGSQYHFQMEPHVCICVPREDGMDVMVASQWIQQVQSAIASCLGMPNNLVHVQVRRLGGGFGVKITRSTHIATACALAAFKTKKPVRMVLDLETGMKCLGKRLPFLYPYEVGFDGMGKILNLTCKIICDPGCTSNESTAMFGLLGMQSCYAANGWQLIPGQANTNTPPNTYCRAPAIPQAVACFEYILEHIAFFLKKDPLEVRQVNFMKKGDPIFAGQGTVLEEDNLIPAMLEELRTSADLDERKTFIANYNKGNRWKKRGLSLIPLRCPVHYFFSGYNIFLAVYSKDGSVTLAHSGVEMGQGINTKVAQVVAKEFGIPLSKIRVKPTNVLTGANQALTGGAVTSESVCYAAVKACEILNARMAPVKGKLKDPSWELLVMECQKIGMDLTSYYSATYADQIKSYAVWGLTACEVEIDCLTGEYKILRMDMINDAGQSLSPEVDIGQTEGAMIHGLGLWLTEKIQYDVNTGELLTKGTWEYKPPASKDIPEDFRVTFLRKAPNPHGVLGSKATGEAPLSMSVSAFIAIKQAIAEARMDAGNTDWFQLDGPVTPEDIQRLCLTTPSQFVL